MTQREAWLWRDVNGVWSGYRSALHLSYRLCSHLSLHPDGARVASSTGIDILLLDDFKLVINDTTHLVRPPRRGENWHQKGACAVGAKTFKHIYTRCKKKKKIQLRLVDFVCICLYVWSLELLPHEEAERLNDVKFLVQQLYTTLRIEEHQLSKERELIGRLEDLNSQLRPLEKVGLPQHLWLYWIFSTW